VRAWERQPGETSRAYEAFSAYRDLGSARSLAKVGQLLGKSTGLMERWSAAHSWVDRVAALEARDAMLRREAVEEYLAAQAEDHAEREGRIAEKLLEIRERAADQALSIVRWPLSEQRILREDKDGNETTVIVTPSKWSKSTAIGMARLAAGAVPGLAPEREDSGETDAGWDLSVLSEEEIRTFLEISHKLVAQGRGSPESGYSKGQTTYTAACRVADPSDIMSDARIDPSDIMSDAHILARF
jgi:hypothetical protein